MRLARIATLLATLSIGSLTACSKSEAPAGEGAAPAPVKAAASSKFAVGDKVDVDWKGSWYQASILEANGQKYKVHYEGWDAKWDEEVAEDKIRVPEAIAYTYKVDDAVEVQWKATWYKSKILSDEGGGKYKVHYEGWDEKWDEVVPGNRIRKPAP